MKVLIADKFEQSGIEGLVAAGCAVELRPDLKGESLARHLVESGADVLVVRSTAVTSAMLESPALSLVVRAGAGYDTIDVAAASRHGVYVANCPGKNSTAVAELTIGLMIALDRRIVDNVVDLRKGRWNKKDFSQARGLHGQTLGLLGFGRIAQEVASRAAALGMRIAAWSRRFAQSGVESSSLAVCKVCSSPAELAAESDVFSVHLALTPQTRHFVNADLLAKLRPGSCLINTSRAEVVDYAALAAAVERQGLRVGLDVYPDEPSAGTADFDCPIARMPNVYGTHHIGASTEQAQQAIAMETVRIIAEYKATGRVPNVVNIASKSPATHLLIVRHRDRPGVLAHVFDRLRAGEINVQETENIVFEGAYAAVARIHLDGAPDEALLQSIRSGNPEILHLQLVAI